MSGQEELSWGVGLSPSSYKVRKYLIEAAHGYTYSVRGIRPAPAPLPLGLEVW